MTRIAHAPGLITGRAVSGPDEWEGKHSLAAHLIKTCIPDIASARVEEGTRGRPVDSIYVMVKAEGEHDSKKRLTRTIEILLKNVLNLIIDYRVVSIR